jgi:hypothetical protein
MKSFRTTIRLGMVGLLFAMKMNPQGICRLRKASKTALVGAAEDGLGQRARFSKPFKELRMATCSARAETVEDQASLSQCVQAHAPPHPDAQVGVEAQARAGRNGKQKTSGRRSSNTLTIRFGSL